MKKTLTIAVLSTAIVSQAASVAWTTTALSFGSTELKRSTAVTTYLVLLDGSSLSSPYTFTDDFSASSIGTIVDSDTDGTSKGSASAGTLDCTGAANGNVYALLSKYVSDGKTYWNLSQTLNTMAGLDPEDPRMNPTDWADFALSNTVVGESTTLTSGAGWTLAKETTPDVPEPATGALALAGIALLFKRRRA